MRSCSESQATKEERCEWNGESQCRADCSYVCVEGSSLCVRDACKVSSLRWLVFASLLKVLGLVQFPPRDLTPSLQTRLAQIPAPWHTQRAAGELGECMLLSPVELDRCLQTTTQEWRLTPSWFMRNSSRCHGALSESLGADSLL